jgi:ankyrin repeat protein
MPDVVAVHIAAGLDVNACNEEGRTALDLALAKDQEEAASLLRSHNALEGKHLMQKAWRDAGNVVVLDHVAFCALYEDYTMLFGNFNTFKADVKLSAGNSTTSYTSSISKASHKEHFSALAPHRDTPLPNTRTQSL